MSHDLATYPFGDFGFHRGAEFAKSRLGYLAHEVDALPALATASFAGVANPLASCELRRGASVLDVGCGAGLDLLLAAERVGPEGTAIGVDMTPKMVERARSAVAHAGLGQARVRQGESGQLPAPDDRFDVVLANGFLSLVVDKLAALKEMVRVLKPGGRIALGEVVVGRGAASCPRDSEAVTGWATWTSGIAGALPVDELVALLRRAGLTDVRVTEHFDPFLGSPSEDLARAHGVHSVTVVAVKPD
ncbi:MAG: methyltransferase domain-containing protein [Myxococcales bacterium]|nr:methyltransferase domain-containing protein [Myxococcales bacterium]